MATLPTNLKDDILDASVNQRRRYNMITNPDGTVEFEDVTAYIQVGSEYGSGLINETNKQINGKVDDSKIVRDLKTIGAMTQEGFIPDALALKEVNESLNKVEDITNLMTAVSGVTISNNTSKRIGNDIYISFNASWSTSVKEKDLVTIDNSLISDMGIISNCFTYTGGNYYLGLLIRSGMKLYTYMQTATNAVTVYAHWKLI